MVWTWTQIMVAEPKAQPTCEQAHYVPATADLRSARPTFGWPSNEAVWGSQSGLCHPCRDHSRWPKLFEFNHLCMYMRPRPLKTTGKFFAENLPFFLTFFVKIKRTKFERTCDLWHTFCMWKSQNVAKLVTHKPFYIYRYRRFCKVRVAPGLQS